MPKNFLCKPIMSSESPKAYVIIQGIQLIDGWKLLNVLMNSRLTVCGVELHTKFLIKRDTLDSLNMTKDLKSFM